MKRSVILKYFYNNFTTNYIWLVIISFNLNRPLKLYFCSPPMTPNFPLFCPSHFHPNRQSIGLRGNDWFQFIVELSYHLDFLFDISTKC